MFKINAIPLDSINGVKFGMKREMVRTIFGTEFKEFKKSTFSTTTTDDFGFCHVFYNENDECEAVEIFDDVEVYIENRLILPGSIDNIKSIITDFEEDDDSYISRTMSIGIYAPNQKIESILFGKIGYYE
jgi:hypothetical protein